MGKQIEYYMELDSFKLVVKKALDLGFKVVVTEGKDEKICCCFEEIIFLNHNMYFYLEEAGSLIKTENGYLDLFKSPLIESGFSYVNETRKEISKSRLWVSTGYWTNQEEFIPRDELLTKKYSSLTRYIKKLAPFTQVGIKAQNPMYEGKKFERKVYITPFILTKIEKGEYDCI